VSGIIFALVTKGRRIFIDIFMNALDKIGSELLEQ
jgi:hypothetical protein